MLQAEIETQVILRQLKSMKLEKRNEGKCFIFSQKTICDY